VVSALISGDGQNRYGSERLFRPFYVRNGFIALRASQNTHHPEAAGEIRNEKRKLPLG